MALSPLPAMIASVLLGQAAPQISAPVGGTCGTKPGIPPGSCISGWVCLDGSWEPTYKAAGSSCNDGNACSHTDRCDAYGVCTGTPITCTSDKCTTRTCNGTSTCSATPVPTDDGNPCTADSCDLVAGVKHTPTPGTGCNDGNACTYGDTCNPSGACVGTAITCASDECISRTCNGTSSCSVTLIQAGTPCGGDATCGCSAAGQCVASSPVSHYCYDAAGNMTAQLIRASGAACQPLPGCP